MFFKCVKCGKRFFLPGKRLACYRQHCHDEAVAKDALDRHECEQDRIFNAEARQHKTELASRRQTAYQPPRHAARQDKYSRHDAVTSDPFLFVRDSTPDRQESNNHCRTRDDDPAPTSNYESSSNDSCSGGGDD